MLNFELVESTNFNQELDENEQKKMHELYSAKLEIKACNKVADFTIK